MRKIPPHPRALLFAKLPERLDEQQRRNKYDEPLASALHAAGVGDFVRGFSQPGDYGEVESVGLEVDLVVMQNGPWVAKQLLQLGAPLDTVIEIETEKATIDFTLAEAMGR